MPKKSLKEIGDTFLKFGNKYPYLMKCPKCGEEYFALFDKIYIDHMGFCYWPCGNSEDPSELAGENVLNLIEEIM